MPIALPPGRAARMPSTLARWLVLGLGVLLAAGAPAQNLSEEQLRVRFLLNFLRFVTWPDDAFASPSAPIQVCVLGTEDILSGALPEIAGAMVGTHRTEIRGNVTADNAASCQLLYASDAQLRRLKEARAALGRRPVLIVGESELALDRGGAVAFRANERHLGFVVKLGTAKDTGLNFAPQMLGAAAEVLP